MVLLAGLLGTAAPLAAQGIDPGATIEPLRVQPPGPPAGDLDALVKDQRWLVALGRALFWDSTIGSDGNACASCHFHAGADPRIVNQLTPGLLVQPFADDTFGGIAPAGAAGLTRGGFLNGTGKKAAPNIKLDANDFPFHQLSDPDDRNSAVLYDTNDVASSQGVFDGTLIGLDNRVRFRGRTRDFCKSGDDTIFTITIAGKKRKVRKVEPRNTPTVINAAYFYRNFWDGRANNIFNGVSPFGLRDRDARIVRLTTPGVTTGLETDTIALQNSSLASQAVGPPNSSFEMACANRTFADIGRKMLARTALATQKIASSDSVFGTGPLGNLILTPGNRGLKYTYERLVQLAFEDDLWAGTGTYTVDGSGNVVPSSTGFTQAELNFSLFFGLSVDAYERTLVSNQTRFDNGTLSTAEQRGKDVFTGKGKCVNCHTGPLFSSAAVPPRQVEELVERMPMGDGGTALYDGGFYNIGVRPTHEDIGVGGLDPWGNPLSFTRQYKRKLTNGTDPVDPFFNDIDPCRFEVPFTSCGGPSDDLRVAVDGAFKTPTLRNIALTAPYFHNGGQKSLEEVVDFYDRGGDRRGPDGNDTTGTGADGEGRPITGPNMGGSNLDPDITDLGLDDGEKADLVAFLKALTDERVRCHKAPFDHPELIMSNGHKTTAAGTRAADAKVRLPEVGSSGFGAAACGPNTGNLFTYNLVGTGKMLQPQP